MGVNVQTSIPQTEQSDPPEPPPSRSSAHQRLKLLILPSLICIPIAIALFFLGHKPSLWDQCAKIDEASVAACTHVIADGDAESRPMALLNRSSAYAQTGKLDLAMSDVNEAIRLSPNLAAGFTARGNIYMRDEKPELAFADYDQAIRLKPQGPNLYFNALPFMN